jgi:ankyrin repeat protein
MSVFDVCENVQGGWTAIICAANKGRTDCVRLLLETGADTKTTDSVRSPADSSYLCELLLWLPS